MNEKFDFLNKQNFLLFVIRSGIQKIVESFFIPFDLKQYFMVILILIINTQITMFWIVCCDDLVFVEGGWSESK